MNQSHPYYNALILKRTLTVLTMVIVLLSGASMNAQGLMRGESSLNAQESMLGEADHVSASPTQGQDTEARSSMDRWETPSDGSVESASSAQSAEVAETVNYLNNDQFRADLNVNALSVIGEDELEYEVRKLIQENQRLKTEVEAQQKLIKRIAQLESTIEDMEDGWEIVKQY